MITLFFISAVTIGVSANHSLIELDIEVPSAKIIEIETERGVFNKIIIDNEGALSDIGKPKIPVIRRFVEIPWGADAKVSGQVLKSEEIILEFPIIPLQPLRKMRDREIPFTMDKDFYQQDSYYPNDIVKIVNDGVIRGHRVLTIEIAPVQYNPVSSRLILAKKIKVKIALSNSDINLTNQMVERYYSKAFDPVLKSLILNYNSYKPPKLPIGYLIITPDSWANYLSPLVEWRKRKGYHVTVATKSQTGSTKEEIKNYIQNAYNNWSIPPSFVLLVGDVDSMPFWIDSLTWGDTDSITTDLNYSLLQGNDFFPDVDLSRLSVANPAQLDSFVKKTIKYERNDWISGTDWCKKSYWIATSDEGPHALVESTLSYCMEIVRKHGMETDSIWLFYDKTTPVLPPINDGRSWVVYFGHGSVDAWSDADIFINEPIYPNNDVYDLTNTDKVPFVQSYACNCGEFAAIDVENGECFSEAWLRVGYRGAIAHLAASTASSWHGNWVIMCGVIDAAFDSGYYWIMGMVNRGKYAQYLDAGDPEVARAHFDAYNLMGDGSIDVYTDIPHQLTVTHPTTISTGKYNLEVKVLKGSNPVKDALVGIKPAKDDTVFAGYTNSTGEVTISIYTSQPETVYITVTGHNLKTYEGYCLAGIFVEEKERICNSFKLTILPNSVFKENVEISYTIPSGVSSFSLKVYDISGREVWGIKENRTTPGVHKISWAKVDNRGRKIGSGVYFVSIKAEDIEVLTKKIVILK